VTYLLDTNVVSELRKRAPDERVAAWVGGADAADLFLSVLVVGEIRQGIERVRRRGDDAQAAALDGWLRSLTRSFADRLLPISAPIAELWGRIGAVTTLPVVDGLMAASALHHGLTLVTRDTRAISATGAAVFDPWSPRSEAP